MTRAPKHLVLRRALAALTVLVAFYVTTGGIALVLLPFPIAALVATRNVLVTIASAGVCWVVAYGLVSGLVLARPPRFEPPGEPLRRQDAPRFFALVDELAARAGTRPPDDIYLDAMANAGVMETGSGFLGLSSRRVMIVGVPLIASLDEGELRAVLAHELGHYVGGDTQLTGITAFLESAFRAVLAQTTYDPFRAGTTHWAIELGKSISTTVGRGLVRGFMWVYLSSTRGVSQAQEFAADAFSAQLTGHATAIRALDRSSVMLPLYDAYLALNVVPALQDGAMPTDLLEGFARFHQRVHESGLAAKLETTLRAKTTDPFDTHPALAERIAALGGVQGPAPTRPDAPSARSYFEGSLDLDRFLVERTFAHVSGLRKPPVMVTWSEAAERVFPAAARERARRVASRLHPQVPHAQTLAAMLAAVLDAYGKGQMTNVALYVEPALADVVPAQRGPLTFQIVVGALTFLLEGALVEAGAIIEPSLGEECLVVVFEGETLRPALIAREAMDSAAARAQLLALSARLDARQSAALS